MRLVSFVVDHLSYQFDSRANVKFMNVDQHIFACTHEPIINAYTQPIRAQCETLAEFNTKVAQEIAEYFTYAALKNVPIAQQRELGLTHANLAWLKFLLSDQGPDDIREACRTFPIAYFCMKRVPTTQDIREFICASHDTWQFITAEQADPHIRTIKNIVARDPVLLQNTYVHRFLTPEDLINIVEQCPAAIKHIPDSMKTPPMAKLAASAGLIQWIPRDLQTRDVWDVAWDFILANHCSQSKILSYNVYPGGMPADQWTPERLRHTRLPDAELDALHEYLRAAQSTPDNDAMLILIIAQATGFPVNTVIASGILNKHSRKY